jgi:low affinity Fe/Cu permease
MSIQPKSLARKDFFSRFARKTASASGSPVTFGIAVLIIVVWGVTGPLFHYSDTWQLVINTSTTIITFLMVFLIQNTQNRDSQAVQLKLDELIRSSEKGHNALMDLEELSVDELEEIHKRYLELADAARRSLRRGEDDTGSPAIKLEEDPKGG